MTPVVHAINRYSYRFIVVGRSCAFSYHTSNYVIIYLVYIVLYRHAIDRVCSLLLCYTLNLSRTTTRDTSYEYCWLSRFTDPSIKTPGITYLVLTIRSMYVRSIHHHRRRPHLRERWVCVIAYCEPQLPVL